MFLSSLKSTEINTNCSDKFINIRPICLKSDRSDAFIIEDALLFSN